MITNENQKIMEIAKAILSVLFIFGLAYFTILSATNHRSRVFAFATAVIVTFLLLKFIQKYLVGHSGKVMHKNN